MLQIQIGDTFKKFRLRKLFTQFLQGLNVKIGKFKAKEIITRYEKTL